MEAYLIHLLLYFSLVCGASILGGIVPACFSWNPNRVPLFLSLSAGLMLGSCFIHLLPEAFEMVGDSAGVSVLLGLFFLYFIERFVTVHVCEADTCEVHKIGLAAVMGLCIHSLTDGVALGVGLSVPKMGLTIFLAIIIHKAMEAFSLTSILLHLKKSRSYILWANAALLLAIPLGALLSYAMIGQENLHLAGMAIGFSAGTFLHISLSDLLPAVHKHSNLKNRAFLFFVSGLILMFLLEKYLHHG